MFAPPISCLCVTFGRPQWILEEAVFSFLNQDYPGPKELLLLNDFDQQTIVFDHPEVRIVNVPVRFGSLGEKRNAAVAMCRHDLIAVWDDDDIYLPHRLRYSISRYDPARRFFKPTQAFMLNDGVLRGPRSLLFHAGSLWHRSLFDEAGGYPHMGSGEDAHLEARFQQVIGSEIGCRLIQPCDIYYIYRWAGTQSYHLSSFGRDTPGRSGNDCVMEYVEQQIAAGAIRAGEIVLHPRWSADYSSMVRDYLATLGG